jgi:hypothetical protein
VYTCLLQVSSSNILQKEEVNTANGEFDIGFIFFPFRSFPSGVEHGDQKGQVVGFLGSPIARTIRISLKILQLVGREMWLDQFNN